MSLLCGPDANLACQAPVQVPPLSRHRLLRLLRCLPRRAAPEALRANRHACGNAKAQVEKHVCEQATTSPLHVGLDSHEWEDKDGRVDYGVQWIQSS
jgi:hypothetical protein